VKTRPRDLADRVANIDSWLPQTQCTQCGFPRCQEYATAIAEDKADINQCPPGGEITIRALAAITGKIGKPLNETFGFHSPREVANIDEAVCIGCVMCINACPVDAIVGATKHMHTIVPDLCTGCELCIEPCPVDCISMQPASPLTPEPGWQWPDYSPEQVDRAQKATYARLARLEVRAANRGSTKKLAKLKRSHGPEQIRQEIRAAVTRKRSERSNRGSDG
jgi:electron transport complex protein RnfB